jgi:hypothetical protein
MSLSEDTGPYFPRPGHPGFQMLDFKASAAAEVTAAVRLLGSDVRTRITTVVLVA